MKNLRTLLFSAGGSDTLHRGRKNVRTLLSSGKTPTLTLEKTQTKVLLMLNGESCGHVLPADEKDVLDIVFNDNLEDVTIKAVELAGTGFLYELFLDVAVMPKAKEAEIELDSEIKRIVSSGIDTEANLKQKIAYMRKVGVPALAIQKILESYTLYPSDVAARIVAEPKVKYVDKARIMARTVAYTSQNRNLLFEGERGVGKNVATETLSWLTNRPLYEFSMNSQHDNSSLLGSSTLVLEDGESVVAFETSPIVQAAEHGGILVLDEFNTTLGHIMSILNSLLDDRRRIAVPGYKAVEAHANFLAIATQNRNYTDTFSNNEATSDRFVPIVFPSNTDIASIINAKVPGMDEDIVKLCSKIFDGIRSSAEAGAIDEKSQTVRGFIDACLGISVGLTIKEALIDNLANRTASDDEREAIKGIIDMHLT